MKAYRLYNEWRGRRVIGETLADALMRNGLQEPDKYEYQQDEHGRRNVKTEDGAKLTIAKVIVAEKENLASTRGSDHFVTAILETDTGRIVEVDAKIEEVIS